MLKAVAFRVVIKPDPVIEKTQSGILIATDKKLEQGATVTGIIVDIGPDAWSAYKPSEPHAGLKVGDHVYYAKYAGKWVASPPNSKNDEDQYLIVNDDDIVAKV